MCTGSGDGNDAASNMDPGRRSSTEFTKVLDPGERVERACCWLCPLGELLVGTILSVAQDLRRHAASPVLDPGRCRTRPADIGRGRTAVTAPTRSKTFVVSPR